AWIPGGEFWMGGVSELDAQPWHKVYVDGFWMDKHERTNGRWAEFVKETGYLTVAEKKPDPKDLPGLKEEFINEPVSLVFTPPREFIYDTDVAHLEHRWWSGVKGACWQRPEGR